MLRIAYKQGEPARPVVSRANEHQQLKELIIRKHNEKIQKQKKRLANAKRPTDIT